MAKPISTNDDDMTDFIAATTRYPLAKVHDELVFLNQFIDKASKVFIGDYTYYHDVDGASEFQRKNILYHHPLLDDELHIGRFCSIAMGTKFLMSGAMHQTEGSTYPFEIFMPELITETGRALPYQKKDSTMIGHDVWLGLDSVIMPGVKIGNGAIIGTRAIVTKDIPPYSVAVGHPAQLVKLRYSEEVINRFEKLAWWHWPVDKIRRHIKSIVDGDITALEAAT